MDYFDLLRFGGVPTRVIRTLWENGDKIVSPKDPYQDRYLHGPQGSGKTTYAAHILSQAIQGYIHAPNYFPRFDPNSPEYIAGYRPEFADLFIFANLPQTFYTIKQSFNKNHTGPTEGQIIDRLLSAKLLVLDDLGVEMPTDWGFQTLYLIVNHRYSEMLPTIYTSNRSPNELEGQLSDPRLVARLVETCSVEEMSGKNWRSEGRR